eukprot:gene622-2053_t
MQLKASVSVRSTGASRVARASNLPSVRPVPCAVPFQSSIQKRESIISFAAAQVEENEYQYERVRLTGDEDDVSLLKIPEGYHWYETMMILKPTLSEEERDQELAKFAAFLDKEERTRSLPSLRHSRTRRDKELAKFEAFLNKEINWEGIYVLYTYSAKRQTAKTIQLLLSTPESGAEDNILRHLSFCRL